MNTNKKNASMPPKIYPKIHIPTTPIYPLCRWTFKCFFLLPFCLYSRPILYAILLRHQKYTCNSQQPYMNNKKNRRKTFWKKENKKNQKWFLRVSMCIYLFPRIIICLRKTNLSPNVSRKKCYFCYFN